MRDLYHRIARLGVKPLGGPRLFMYRSLRGVMPRRAQRVFCWLAGIVVVLAGLVVYLLWRGK